MDAGAAPAAGTAIFGERIDLAAQYVELLATRGIEWGLLGPREADRMWQRHLLNSVAHAERIPEAASVIDVGSGAGLPGIPLALARPDLHIQLLEPLARRSEFLQLAIEELGLAGRVGVERGRAEDAVGQYDVVTCRALAPLRRMIPQVWHLLRPAGELLALKGSTAADDVEQAGPQLRRVHASATVLAVSAHPEIEPTFVVRVRGSGVT